MEKFDGSLFIKRVMDDFIPMRSFTGIDLLNHSDNSVSVKIHFDEELVSNVPDREVHNGILASAMDAVGGAIAMKQLTNGDHLSTINMSVNYLRRTKPKDIVIDAKVTKNGQRVIFTEMSAHHVDEDTRILATANAAYSHMKKEN